jgi:hypothetical protein
MVPPDDAISNEEISGVDYNFGQFRGQYTYLYSAIRAIASSFLQCR